MVACSQSCGYEPSLPRRLPGWRALRKPAARWLEKPKKPNNLTQVWIPPRLSHSLYHTSALLEEKRRAYLVIIFSSFTLYICKKERVTSESMVLTGIAVVFEKLFSNRTIGKRTTKTEQQQQQQKPK